MSLLLRARSIRAVAQRTRPPPAARHGPPGPREALAIAWSCSAAPSACRGRHRCVVHRAARSTRKRDGQPAVSSRGSLFRAALRYAAATVDDESSASWRGVQARGADRRRAHRDAARRRDRGVRARPCRSLHGGGCDSRCDTESSDGLSRRPVNTRPARSAPQRSRGRGPTASARTCVARGRAPGRPTPSASDDHWRRRPGPALEVSPLQATTNPVATERQRDHVHHHPPR
jgi:hypothetical protein